MSDREQKYPQIDPELLWNSLGMVQQAVMFALLLISYVSVYMLVSRAPGLHPGLESWLSSLNDLFVTDAIFKDIALGIAAGLAAVILTSVLDVLVALIGGENMRDWMHRTDHLLPETSAQKRWALIISVTGSIQEEIMFRGFIFIALIPVWSHWLWAALILSAFFSLLHAGVQGFWSTIWIFIISVMLCMAIALGFSIYMAAVMHIVINLCNLFILPLLFKKQDE